MMAKKTVAAIYTTILLALCSPAQADIYFVHNDHLGTPQTISDKDQQIVWQADYEPFGTAQVTTEELEINIRFPGQYYDEETRLHYNYFRMYDPSTGRYIQPDPIGLDGGMNTYAYVSGNPNRFIDPKGLDVWSTDMLGPSGTGSVTVGTTVQVGANTFDYTYGTGWNYGIFPGTGLGAGFVICYDETTDTCGKNKKDKPRPPDYYYVLYKFLGATISSDLKKVCYSFGVGFSFNSPLGGGYGITP